MLRRRKLAAGGRGPVFPDSAGGWRNPSNTSRDLRNARGSEEFAWVTSHVFRKTVATLISEATTSELASRQLGHSSSQVTRDHYIAKPPISADLSELLERLAESDDASSDS